MVELEVIEMLITASLSGLENAELYTMQGSHDRVIISCTICHSVVAIFHSVHNRVIISKAIPRSLWSLLLIIRGILPKFGNSTPLLSQLLVDDIQQLALHLL